MSSAPTWFHLCLLFAAASLAPIIAQETSSPTIAVIDLARAFEAHPATEAATATLTKEREAARGQFREKSEALKKVLQTHQELIRAGKRTEAAEKLKEANELEKAIATLRTTQQRDLEQRFVREKHRIMGSIRAAVRQFNAEGRFAVVLDQSAESAFGVPAVIDASGAEDITDAIIALVKANPELGVEKESGEPDETESTEAKN